MPWLSTGRGRRAAAAPGTGDITDAGGTRRAQRRVQTGWWHQAQGTLDERPAMDEAMLRQAVRYQHVRKVFPWMPGARETGWYAALLGTDEATVTRLRGESTP